MMIADVLRVLDEVGAPQVAAARTDLAVEWSGLEDTEILDEIREFIEVAAPGRSGILRLVLACAPTQDRAGYLELGARLAVATMNGLLPDLLRAAA